MKTLVLLLFASTTLACSSAPFTCDRASAPHPPRNFGAVAGSMLYRGGQPTDCAQLDYLRSRGVTRIVKLNDRGLPQDAAEKAEAARRGIEVFSVPFDAGTIGTAGTCDDVGRVLAFLRESGAPVFVHCTAGKDRTGYIVGLYERFVLGKSIADVMEELRRYGHRGARANLMPQIDRELRKDVPLCVSP